MFLASKRGIDVVVVVLDVKSKHIEMPTTNRYTRWTFIYSKLDLIQAKCKRCRVPDVFRTKSGTAKDR